jgi:hypothetical protein
VKAVKSRKIKDLFSSGDFKALLELYEKGEFKEEDRIWISSALCIFGKMKEGKFLYKKSKVPSQVLFFLCIGFIRLTKYEDGKKYLRLLAQAVAQSKLAEDKFFYYQALAFYSHFFCRYQKSLYFAQKSFEQTVLLKKSLWKIFSLDLIGHNHVALGQIYKGIHHLQEAKELARLLGNQSFVKATEISLLNYECHFSEKVLFHLRKVELKLKNLSSIDNYSKQVLLLTEAKLEILSGQMSRARKTLRRAFDQINKQESKRHLGQYFFLTAYLEYLQDREQVALELLENAENIINKEIDLALFLKVVGLKQKIYISLGIKDDELNKKIIDLSKKIGDSRSLARLYRLGLIQSPYSEDPLQGFFDQFFSDSWKEVLPQLLDYGYHGLLREKLKNKNHAYAILGIKPKSVLFLTKEGTHLSLNSLSLNLLKILKLILVHKRVSKEFICQHVWGYQYEPQRHDSNIYALIHRLRALLGPYSQFLLGEDHHYRIDLNFEILDLSVSHEYQPSPQCDLQSAAVWNIRQQKILSHFARGEFLRVSDYARITQVTTMTALRDLRQLVEKKMINKYGRARATIYGM